MTAKVCIVASAGGHLTEVRLAEPAYASVDHFFVLNKRVSLPEDMVGRTYFIAHGERDVKLMINLFEAIRILRRERPTVVLSTGASPIVPVAIVAKMMRIPVIFVETITRVTKPSLTGRIMYHLTDHFFYQWPALEKYFPNGRYVGHWFEAAL